MPDSAGASVLVIDDEAQIRRFLGIGLRAQGYVVHEAATGRPIASPFSLTNPVNTSTGSPSGIPRAKWTKITL